MAQLSTHTKRNKRHPPLIHFQVRSLSTPRLAPASNEEQPLDFIRAESFINGRDVGHCNIRRFGQAQTTNDRHKVQVKQKPTRRQQLHLHTMSQLTN